MSTAGSVDTVGEALADIARWRSDEVARQKAELVEVDQELQNLRAALENLHSQIEALEKFRVELTSREGGVAQQEIEKGYHAIFGALGVQARRMAERAAAVAVAEEARRDATLESIARSDAAPQFEDYRQFKTMVEPTLSALPESYRTAVVQHHQQLAGRLREHVARLLAGPVEIDAEPLEVELVYGVDAPDGAPELLVAVLPVADEVHERWAARAEDLQTHLAARAVQAIYQAVAEAGPPGAQAMCGGHLGLLAVEADLVGAGEGIGEAIGRQLAAVLGAAPELAAARVRVAPREVPIDYLLPPEDDDAPVTEVAHA